MSEIVTILRQTLEREGQISFARFMELALYCPDLGYYEQNAARLGGGGDFFTSVSVGSLFGDLLAFQFAGWLADGHTGVFQLVEAGAHEGQLALDVLTWMETHRPEILSRLEYWVVEPSRNRQGWQKRTLERFGRQVRWVTALEHLSPEGVSGAIFANELLDAFPVHRLGWDARAGVWFEWGVGVAEGRLVWQRLHRGARDWRGPLAEAGFELPVEVTAVLPDHFTIEISPAAGEWWRRAALALRRGRLLTFDYGLTVPEFLAPQRAGGTLRGYFRHHLVADVLARPGEQDLTAHVNFTQLRRAGEQSGLRTEDLLSQALYLTRVAGSMWQAGSGVPEPSAAQVRQFRTLTHPEHLGHSFRVLIQGRESGEQAAAGGRE